MLPVEYTRFVFNQRPKTTANDDTFRKVVSPLNLTPGSKQALVKVLWISIDPAIREWMRDRRSFLPPMRIGETIRALGIGTIIEPGPESILKAGDLVAGLVGFAEYAILDQISCEIIKPEMLPAGIVLEDYLGALSTPGMAAYFGLQDIGQLKPGETLVVTAAAGATGSMACQLGKRARSKVVAIAGTAEKCAWLKELGCDVVLNYKSPSFYADFEKDVDTFDVYFDNVGGELSNYLLSKINRGARIVMCGGISHYNSEVPEGLTNYHYIVTMSVRMEGFVVSEFIHRWNSARRVILAGIVDGTLKRKFHVVEGLDNAPAALNLLFSGQNTGKVVVQVSSINT